MTCSSCQHWSLQKAGRMAAQGYGLCSLLKPWLYKAPQYTCQKHKPADADVAHARVEWLNKKAKK